MSSRSWAKHGPISRQMMLACVVAQNACARLCFKVEILVVRPYTTRTRTLKNAELVAGSAATSTGPPSAEPRSWRLKMPWTSSPTMVLGLGLPYEWFLKLTTLRAVVPVRNPQHRQLRCFRLQLQGVETVVVRPLRLAGYYVTISLERRE